MPNSENSPSKTRIKIPDLDRLTWVLVAVALVLACAAGIILASIVAGNGSEDNGTTTQVAGSSPADAVPILALPGAASQATPTASPAPVTPPPCEAPQDWVVHTVGQGDTLYGLAEQYDTDVDSLTRVNCLDTDLIVIGQELYVPGPPAAATSTIAQAGPLPTERPILVDLPQPNFSERFLNIILLGSDKREDQSTWRTDTMIVVSIDTERNIVRLLSLPRDLWVTIPGQGEDRLNSAELWGELAREGSGPDVVKQTIYNNLQIPIHHYVRVDMEGFTEIIDAVGGVDVDVECPLTDLEIETGMHHFDGETALLYARSRITTNDFDRSRRQRKLLMALWEQALTVDLIPRLPLLWFAMGGAFETDLPLKQVVNLAYVGLRLRPNHIFSQSLGPWQVQNWTTPEGAAVLLPLHEEIQELLSVFYGPIDFEFLDRISRTRVEILNGSQLPQSGDLAATNLRWGGFQIAGVGPDEGQATAATQVLVYNDDLDVAKTLAQLMDLPPTAVIARPDPASPVEIRVILGSNYDPCEPQ
jgi:LCP family protein required for cell wall assembly